MNAHNNPLHIEKHLLSVFECGCYISTHDIVSLAKQLGFELAFKKRASLMQTLLLYAQENKDTQRLFNLLFALLETKSHEIQTLISGYPHAYAHMNTHLLKIHATKMLLGREYALHVKESNHDT